MPRFTVDDYVQIRDLIFSPYQGQIGRVTKVKPSARKKQTLDKYWVRFSDAAVIEVWDIQLTAVESPESHASNESTGTFDNEWESGRDAD
ncbi:MAG TPA: hypothetical protein VE422_38785 [Terriglobia bacterium]|nr:hypothetical protein [Terriglobia bacterium]